MTPCSIQWCLSEISQTEWVFVSLIRRSGHNTFLILGSLSSSLCCGGDCPVWIWSGLQECAPLERRVLNTPLTVHPLLPWPVSHWWIGLQENGCAYLDVTAFHFVFSPFSLEIFYCFLCGARVYHSQSSFARVYVLFAPVYMSCDGIVYG